MLADGTVTNANTDENNDLFWALKGGGPNFGIVAKYELYTVPVNRIWYQIAIYSNDLASNVLDVFAAWQVNQGASDFKGHVLLGFGLDSVILGLVYSAPIERPDTFAPFYELEALQVAVPSTIGTLASLDQAVGAFTLPGHFRSASPTFRVQLDGPSANCLLLDMTTEARALASTRNSIKTFTLSG